jgi:hypothetical protein
LLLKTIRKPLEPSSQGQELIPPTNVVSQLGFSEALGVFGDASKMLCSGSSRFVVHRPNRLSPDPTLDPRTFH